MCDLADDLVSSQLFAICCIVVTYRGVSSLILQSDGKWRFPSKVRGALRKRIYVELSSSTLVQAPTHVGIHAGSYASRGRAHRGLCVAPQDHTARKSD